MVSQKRSQSRTFCSCIKKVQKTLKTKEEGRAIAICVKSVLQSRGKTLRSFRCRGTPKLVTQKYTRKASA
jgi:hypothetical protein